MTRENFDFDDVGGCTELPMKYRISCVKNDMKRLKRIAQVETKSLCMLQEIVL